MPSSQSLRSEAIMLRLGFIALLTLPLLTAYTSSFIELR